jgi:hypothetical protein
VRWSLFLLALLACEKPCPLLCANDGDCGFGAHCLNQVTCLRDCYSCNGVCVTNLHDNCGTGCQHTCMANEFCGSGLTTCVAACESGTTSCSGACMNLQIDRLNCGACGHVCASDQSCAQGACVTVNSCP